VRVCLEIEAGSAPARSTILAKPAVENGEPRSLTNTNDDAGFSRCSLRSALNSSRWRKRRRQDRPRRQRQIPIAVAAGQCPPTGTSCLGAFRTPAASAGRSLHAGIIVVAPGGEQRVVCGRPEPPLLDVTPEAETVPSFGIRDPDH
jgi:hypothetical protein